MDQQKLARRPREPWLKDAEAEGRAVLARVFEVTGWTSQKQVCAQLGRDESVLSRRLLRGQSIPDDWLRQICYDRPIRWQWLKTGEPPKERPIITWDLVPAELRSVFEQARCLPPDYQRSLAHAVRLLSRGPASLAQHLADQIDILVMAAERQRRDFPCPPYQG